MGFFGEQGLKIARGGVDTSHMGYIQLQTLDYLIAAGNAWTSQYTNMFKEVKSMTNQSFPLFLGTNPAGAQNFDCSLGFILLLTPCNSNSLIKPLAWEYIFSGIDQGLKR